MLVQDTLTGAVHQVPEDSMYGYADDNVVYDGYGNPVGFPPLLPILSSLAPVVLPPLFKAITSGFKGPSGYGYVDDYIADDVVMDGYGYPYEGQMVYDGFGNPVGFAPLAALTSLIPGAASIASKILPGVAQTAAKVLPNIVSSAARAIPGAISSMIPRLPFPIPGLPRPAVPVAPPPVPAVMHPRFPSIPPGWMRPGSPYTGPRPARMYMRCATWPGPTGLVPTHPGTVTPAVVPAATTPAAAAPRVRHRPRVRIR